MNIFRRLFFNLWYYFRSPWDTGISPPELMDFIESHPPGRALDLGYGTGTNVITLAQQGWQVTGVDFAWRAIQIARRKVRQAGVDVDVMVGDVTNPGAFAGLFDLIFDLGCFHSLLQGGRQAYLRNLERSLAPAGTYLLYMFLKKSPVDGGPGVADVELAAFPPTFNLIARQDGTERGRRPSAWLSYRRS